MGQVRRRPPHHGGAIDLAHAKARVGEAETEITVVREKDQPLAVVIEPAHGEKVSPLGGKQFADGGALFRVMTCANAARRLVERDVELATDLYRLAVHGHLVPVGINLGAELSDSLAIHRDPSGKNHLLARAAGSHAGIGEELLQTNHGGG